MMHHKRSLIGLLGIAAGVLILGSCGSSEDPTATPRPAAATSVPQPTATATPDPEAQKYGGMLVFNLGNAPAQLDVLQTTTSGDTTEMNPFYDGFFIVEADRTFSPAQAESWEISSDNKSITLHLQRGINFHDGTPFNAAAVKNHFDYILDEENKFEQRRAIAIISSVDVVDEYTIRLNMTKGDALVLPNLAARPGWVVSPTYRDATPKVDRKLKPVGAGAFKYLELVPDSHLTYERWEDNFTGGTLPYLDRLQGVFITDPAVSMASYRAGELDVFGANATQRQLLKDDSTTEFYKRSCTEWQFINFNPRFAPMDDVRVRKAFAMSIDREAYVETLLLGDGVPLWGVIGHAWPWAYDPNYKQYAYNPEESKRLLAEAGFADGFKTGPVTWWGKESNLPRMNLLADMAKQVGIELDLVMLESLKASRGFRLDKENGAYSSSWGTGSPDLHTVFADWFDPQGSGWMFEGFVDQSVEQELTEVLQNGRETLDFATRAQFYQRAQDIVNEHMLGTSLAQGFCFTTHRDHVENYESFPSGGGHQWFKVWLDK